MYAVLLWPLLATLGWALTRLIAGSSEAARKGGMAAAALFVVLRLVDALTPILNDGPAGWLAAIGQPVLGWYPSDAALLCAALSALAWPLGAALSPDKRPLAGDRPAWAFPVAAAIALFLPLATWAPLGQSAHGVPGVDWLALLPLAALVFADTSRTARPSAEALPPTKAVIVAPVEAQDSAGGAEAAWRGKAIGAQDTAWLALPGVDEPGGAPAAVEAWSAVGGLGSPPACLDALLTALDGPASGVCVGDLSAPMDAMLTAAVVRIASLHRGVGVLVIGPDEIAPRIAQALPTAAGPVCVGVGGLRMQLAEGTAPAAVTLTPADLNDEGLRLLADDTPAARQLRCELGLIVLVNPDADGPLLATWQTLLYRRLGLLFDGHAHAPDLFAVGRAGQGLVSMLQRSFPGHALQAVGHGARTRAPVNVFLADFQLSRRGTVGADVAVAAAQGSRWITSRGADAGRPARATLDGHASVSRLDDVRLVQAFRSLQSRVATPGVADHAALWLLQDDPVTRFLAGQDTLRALLAHRKLPSPAPIVGHHHRGLGRAHLAAACRDDAHDVPALSAAFGPSLTDELLRSLPAGAISAWRTRLDDRGRLVRGPVVARGALAPGPRPVATEKTVQVIDTTRGVVLAEVDTIIAPTRLFPHRILTHEGVRYEVPLHAHDTQRGRVEVARLPEGRPDTHPMLTLKAAPKEILEAPRAVHTDRGVFRVVTVDVIVDEAVDGVRRADGTQVTWAPVTARYRTRARLIGFEAPSTPAGLAHIAASLHMVLHTHTWLDEDDAAVIAVPAGFVDGFPAGVLIVDRFPQGMGLAEALEPDTVRSLLDWVWAISHRCTCPEGCERCTPAAFLAAGRPARTEALAILGAA